MTTNITPGESTNFFQEYFIKPIIQRTGYNPVSTLTYGILLVIGAYLLFKFLKRLGYKINFRFFKASVPFILLVSVWRSLTDAGVYPYGFLTTTPGLYLPVILLFFPLIILSQKIKIKGRYEFLYSGISTALLITQLIIFITLAPNQLNIEAAWKVIYFTIIAASPFIFFYVIGNTIRKSPVIKSLKKKLRVIIKPLSNKLNSLMFIAHMFDATVTHVSLEFYNYFEQHVVPRLVFDLAGTSASFYAWKILVLGVVIYLLDKEKSNEELIKFIKMIFITYGLATGVRGFLRLILGV